jgi:uncharacterized protein YbaR (Trm112 family)
MIDKELLGILVCPQDHTPLDAADQALLAKLNRAIAAGRVKNQAGRLVETPLQGGLLRRDRTLLYPIVDDIPLLLTEEAVALDQIE